MRLIPRKNRRILVLPMFILYFLLFIQIQTYAQDNTQYDLALATHSASFLVDHAQINDLNDPNYGGIRGALFPNGTWQYPSGFTETTGYIIASLVDLYSVTANASYLRAAIAASDWEVNVVQYLGSDPAGFGGIRRAFPNSVLLSSWHTATVVNGLAKAWKLTGNQTYRDRVRMGIDFITRADQNQQQIPGAGLIGDYNLQTKYYTSDYLAASAGGQAYFLLSANQIVQNGTLVALAEKKLDVLASAQLQNGTWMRYVYNNGTGLPFSYHRNSAENYAHYIMYIAGGMAQGYRALGKAVYLNAAIRAWNYVAHYLLQTSGLIGNGRAEVAQFGLVSRMLYDSTGNSTYLSYVNEEFAALLGVQKADGSLLNGDFTKSTWASKFAIDLTLLVLGKPVVMQPYLLDISVRIYAVTQSYDGRSLTITIMAPSDAHVVSKVFSGVMGVPTSIIIDGSLNLPYADTWTYDKTTNTTTVTTVQSGSQIMIVLNWPIQRASGMYDVFVITTYFMMLAGGVLFLLVRGSKRHSRVQNRLNRRNFDQKPSTVSSVFPEEELHSRSPFLHYRER